MPNSWISWYLLNIFYINEYRSKGGLGCVCVCVCWWGMFVSVLVPVPMRTHTKEGCLLSTLLPWEMYYHWTGSCHSGDIAWLVSSRDLLFCAVPPQCWGNRHAQPCFFIWVLGDSHSGLHACTASSVTTEPSPQPAPPPEVSNDKFAIRYVVIFCKILKQLQAF